MISVVIPAYNAEAFIAKAVISVLRQTFEDFEVVVIDDGSVDNTWHICERMSYDYPKIRCFSQQNGGANAARAYGVRKCTGQYVTFLDADDTLDNNALELLNLASMTYEADIIAASDCVEPKYLAKNDYIHFLLVGVIESGPCRKLFRKSLFDESVFNIPRNIVIGEDLIMNVRLAAKTSQIYIINAHLYNYTKNMTSLTHTFRPNEEHEDMFYQELEKSIDLALFRADVCYLMLASYKKFIWNNYLPSHVELQLNRYIKEYGVVMNQLDLLILQTKSMFWKRLLVSIDKVRYKFLKLYKFNVPINNNSSI